MSIHVYLIDDTRGILLPKTTLFTINNGRGGATTATLFSSIIALKSVFQLSSDQSLIINYFYQTESTSGCPHGLVGKAYL